MFLILSKMKFSVQKTVFIVILYLDRRKTGLKKHSHASSTKKVTSKNDLHTNKCRKNIFRHTCTQKKLSSQTD